jgi:hypothetical protein
VATEDQHDENKAPPSLSDRGVARRRLVKAGAGVLLTLEARASLASPVCATPSGSLSGGLHNSHYGPQTCTGGLGPDYWRDESNSWPKGLDRSKLQFTTVFPLRGSCPAAPAASKLGEPKDFAGGNAHRSNSGNDKGNGNNGNGHAYGLENGQGIGNDTTPSPATPVSSYQCALLQDVLSPQPFDDSELGRYMAATYLNICAGNIDFLTEDVLRRIWDEVAKKGVYEPTAGVIWSRMQLRQYFESTMRVG